MLRSLYNCQHFPICSIVVLLIMSQFSTKVCYRIEAYFHGMLLYEYCSKGSSTGICVHFILGVVGVVKYLQHGHCHHALLQMLKYTLLWLTPYKIGFFSCKSMQRLHNSTKSINKFLKKFMKPKNNYTYYMVVGFGYSLKLRTLASLICSLSRVMLNPRKVMVLRRKLHFFSL